MAYVAQNQQEDDQNPNGGVQALSSGGGLLGGGGTGSANAGNGSQATTGQTGTGFANLKSYLDANQKATQGLADNVTSKLGDERDQFTSKIGDAGTAFKSALDDRQKINNDLVSQAQTNLGGLNDDQIGTLRNVKDKVYDGPNSISDTDNFRDINNDYSSLLDRSNLTSNEVGRSSLLNEYTDSPTYGQNSLDQYLLQNDSYAKNKLGDFRSQVEGDQTKIDDLVTQTQGNVADYQQALDASSQDLINKFMSEGTYTRNAQTGERVFNDDAGIATNFDRDLNSRYDTALGDLMVNYNNRYAGADDPQYSLNQTGRDAFQEMAGLGLENFASADEFAQEGQYEKLFGEQDYLNNAQSNRAGTWEDLIAELMSGPQRAVTQQAGTTTTPGQTSNAKVVGPNTRPFIG